jgi:hypothetical protein
MTPCAWRRLIYLTASWYFPPGRKKPPSGYQLLFGIYLALVAFKHCADMFAKLVKADHTCLSIMMERRFSRKIFGLFCSSVPLDVP